MITLRSIGGGLEVVRFLPFIVIGNEDRGGEILHRISPTPPILTEKEDKWK